MARHLRGPGACRCPRASSPRAPSGRLCQQTCKERPPPTPSRRWFVSHRGAHRKRRALLRCGLACQRFHSEPPPRELGFPLCGTLLRKPSRAARPAARSSFEMGPELGGEQASAPSMSGPPRAVSHGADAAPRNWGTNGCLVGRHRERGDRGSIRATAATAASNVLRGFCSPRAPGLFRGGRGLRRTPSPPPTTVRFGRGAADRRSGGFLSSVLPGPADATRSRAQRPGAGRGSALPGSPAPTPTPTAPAPAAVAPQQVAPTEAAPSVQLRRLPPPPTPGAAAQLRQLPRRPFPLRPPHQLPRLLQPARPPRPSPRPKLGRKRRPSLQRRHRPTRPTPTRFSGARSCTRKAPSGRPPTNSRKAAVAKPDSDTPLVAMGSTLYEAFQRGPISALKLIKQALVINPGE